MVPEKKQNEEKIRVTIQDFSQPQAALPAREWVRAWQPPAAHPGMEACKGRFFRRNPVGSGLARVGVGVVRRGELSPRQKTCSTFAWTSLKVDGETETCMTVMKG